jgi:putative transposase
MKKSRFTEHQVIAILKEADTGMKAQDVCRHGKHSELLSVESKIGGMEI